MKTIRFVLAFLLAALGVNAQPFDLAGKEQGLRIQSLPASTSPSLNQSRFYTMGGLAGAEVPMDRNLDPAAWYVIPDNGMKFFDPVTTSFGSYMGVSPGKFPAEFGHRIVISVAGGYPVSKYWVEVTSTTAAFTAGYFQVGIDSVTKKEIAFGQNFIGIDFGSNQKLDSVNPGGIWQQKGDDIIYSDGQLPSTVKYDVWYRFGSTSVIKINNISEFSRLDFDFIAKLVVRENENDMVVFTKRISTKPAPVVPVSPRLTIEKINNTTARLNIVGGTVGYDLAKSEDLGSVWATYKQNVSPGDQFIETITPRNFFALTPHKSAVLASVSAGWEIVTTNEDD